MNELLKNIDQSIDCLIEHGKETLEVRPLCAYDLYCSAVLNKGVNVLRGFVNLMRQNNLIAAAPLLRVYLDLLLQLYGSTLVSYDLDEFSRNIFKGRQLGNMKDDRTGKLMRYKYLVKKISKKKGLGWVLDVSDDVCTYSHYSDYISTLNVNLFLEDDKKVMDIILKEDGFISDSEKIELAIKMNQITMNIVDLITEWKLQKEDCFKTSMISTGNGIKV